MQNLNLFTHYDKSLADINRDYLEAKAASRNKQARPKKGRGTLVATFIGLLLITGAGGGYYYTQKMQADIVKTKYAKPEGPDLRSTEEKLGYVKVQIFEFADEPAPQEPVKDDTYESTLAAKIREFTSSNTADRPEKPTAYDEKKQMIDSVGNTAPKPTANVANVNKNIITQPVPKKPTPREQANAAPVAAKPKTYAIVFEDINKNQYDYLLKAGALFNLKAETTGTKPAQKTVWRLYRMDDFGDTVIGGKKANFIKDFDDKEEAVQFAKDNKIQSIIRAEEIDNGLYDAKFCCSTLDNSKKFAETGNVTNKTIKIIRQE